MTHPNCHPSHEMTMVCVAARNAARRNTEWDVRWGNYVHGLNGYRHRKIRKFSVALGNGTLVLHLTSGGVLLRETTDGFIPVYLTNYSKMGLSSICNALNQI